MDIGEEILTREESLMDVIQTDNRDRYPEDRDMVDMFLIDQHMVVISLEIVVHLGGDQILDEERSLDAIDREHRTKLQTLRDILGVDARLVNRSERLWSRNWMAKSRMLMKLLPTLICVRKDSLWEKRC